MRIRDVVLFSVTSPVLSYFSHYLINSTRFGGEGIIEQKMCDLIVSAKFESFPTLKTIQRDVIVNIQMSSCEVLAVLDR